MRRDHGTGDLFAWEPPKVAVGFDAGEIAGNRLGSKISRAVALALKTCGKSRTEVAARMSDELGYAVSVDMLDAYASEAKESHRITLERFVALVTATECMDLLGFVAGLFGLLVVPSKYVAIIELHLVEEQEKKLARHKETLAAKLRAGR
ncbi:hypothetical protein ASD44_09840 [Mesorhizobium sp. Root554]|uniref:hypothetical protein n=2 Tax=unclassified Mesorhizobium TaxID=325217 RepID=UPI0006FFC5E0|nr:hypothetical protein [Mesorhizobium sp. Root554]KQZ15924.1 hypothetical protein ASD27_09850 [Mesorhizobium sp. Root1471]KQZ38434.1 hypothetical protein ASD44_09840 [Mesorhizobium sp. Root554]